jgi:hypothetical protein
MKFISTHSQPWCGDLVVEKFLLTVFLEIRSLSPWAIYQIRIYQISITGDSLVVEK